MVYVNKNENPSQLYLDAIIDVMTKGDETAPRGKRIKELRPAIIQFEDPTHRMSFLKGRRLNPFFNLAESFWVILGRSDVGWLTLYNENMKNFSDDGLTFNAPYGERLRSWGTNAPTGYIHNPFDQLIDVYKKISADTDTRQATASIGNPRFDNSEYTLNGGKDIACNREIFFKVRNGKLDITVTNRSNDVHWGLFGANLPQFATIQEMVASWLDLDVGTYTQISDSFHIYLDDYGAKVTEQVLSALNLSSDNLPTKYQLHALDFTFSEEPRMLRNVPEVFDSLLSQYEYMTETYIHKNDYYDSLADGSKLRSMVDAIETAPDAYFKMTMLVMAAYRAHKLGLMEETVFILGRLGDSQYKFACIRFLYPKYKDLDSFKDLLDLYDEEKRAYIEGE